MTSMVRRVADAGLTCEVEVDGHRLADSGADYLSNVPTVLTGLKLTWGRSGTAEQPSTATCGFTVRDRDGGAEFLGLLHVGRHIVVSAAGELGSGEAPVDIVIDGEFDNLAIPVADRLHTYGGRAAYGDFGGDSGTHVRVTQTSFDPWWCQVHLPPAPFDRSRIAWDDLPQPWPGQTWRIELGVIAGRGAGAHIHPTIFAWPDQRDAATIIGPMAIVDFEALNTAVIEFDIPADAPRGWLGVRIDLTQRKWDETPRTWDDPDLLGYWDEWSSIVLSHFRVFGPPVNTRRVQVFSGRITDLHAAPEGNGVQVGVTAADASAELANLYVGDLAWNAERLDVRARRILTLAGLDLDLDIDAHPSSARVTYRDVDSQAAWGLLSELADSADAVLWCAEHATRDGYVWIEDTAERDALAELAFDADVSLVVLMLQTSAPGGRGVVLSACDLNRDTEWVSDVGDVITRVDLTWNEQTRNEEGKPEPTERHVVRIDPDAESQYGQRRAGYTTQLADLAFAEDVADRVLARSRSVAWHADGVSWDTHLPQGFGDAYRVAALDLLDGTRRIGMPLTVTDLPDISPGGALARYHVEGGTWTFDRGRWIFDVNVSPSSATGKSVTWRDLDPAWPWRDIDARELSRIIWFDLWSVGALNLTPSWSTSAGTWVEATGAWSDRWGPHAQGEAA